MYVVEVTVLFWEFWATIRSCVEPVLLKRACSRLATATQALKTWGQHGEEWEPNASPLDKSTSSDKACDAGILGP